MLGQLKRWRIGVLGVVLTMGLVIAAPPVEAQTVDPLVLPGVGTIPQTSPQTYVLPGYGNVEVSWNGASPANVNAASFAMLNGVTIPASPAVTLPSSVRMLMFDPASAPRSYALTFKFMSGPVNLNRLQLLVFNLGVIGSGKTTVKPTPMPTMGGNYVAPAFPANLTIASGAIQSANNTNGNSGLANFKLSGSTLPTDSNNNQILTLSVDQLSIDQISMTIAYDKEANAPASCCPPLTADTALLANSFAFHQNPGEGIAQHYGLWYTPAPTFDAQMQLWAPYAINALPSLGWTGVAVLQWVDMRTDGAAPGTGAVNSAWPPVAADWAAGTTVQSGPLRLWGSSGAPFAFPDTLADYNLPKPSSTPTAHMEATNGRRYMAAIAYYLWERHPVTKEERLTKICDGTLLSVRRNMAMVSPTPDNGAKTRAPSKDTPLDIVATRASLSTPRTMRVDPALLKRPAERSFDKPAQDESRREGARKNERAD